MTVPTQKTIVKKFMQKMLLIRTYEKLVQHLKSDGQIRTTLHLAIGQEAVPTAILEHITDCDFITTTHRVDHIALGADLHIGKLLGETLGTDKGFNKGNAGIMHFTDKKSGFYGANGIVGANTPISLGIAMAKILKKNDGISIAFTGDGATREGTFHETMNMASLYNAPLLVICENNFYAQSTDLKEHSANPDLAEYVENAYKIESGKYFGNDVVRLFNEIKTAFDYVRITGKPYFAEIMTYRQSGHSSSDKKQTYKDLKLKVEWDRKDPINILQNHAIDAGLMKSSDMHTYQKEVNEYIKKALEYNNLPVKILDEIQ